MKQKFIVFSIQVEYQKEPLGLDVGHPRISWQLKSERRGCRQTAYRIMVGTNVGKSDVWDSGKVFSECSTEVEWGGETLLPCTRYFVHVRVWDQSDETAFADTEFETGLLNTSMDAWEGAEWIGAPRFTVDASTRGVFSIESEFRMNESGTGAGIVFGRNDPRLQNSAYNEYKLCGENYIAYEIDVRQIPAVLNIYRVGYEAGDSKEEPFACVPILPFNEKDRQVITEANRYEYHCLRIEVTGNCAFAYIDGVLIDAVEEDIWGNKRLRGRQLNPRGNNDVITYPRLNEIGFWAGSATTACFKNLTVRNIRKPGAAYICETPAGGLYGRAGIFNEFLERGEMDGAEEAFILEGAANPVMVTANPGNTSIPMFRKTFHLSGKKKIQSGRLYATARGIYECHLNGFPVSKQWFAPGCSQFDKHLLYQTYDITSILQPGSNGIGFTLASGWWSDAQTFVLQNYNYYGDKEALLAKLVVYYEDGSREVLVTDTSGWKYYGEGPYTYAGFFQGERYDARKEMIYLDYSKPDYQEIEWEYPVRIETTEMDSWESMPEGFGRPWPALNETQPEITGSYQAPVMEVCRRTAVSMSEPEKGIYIYDLEQEMAGVPSITFHEKEGTAVTIRFGEMRYPDLPEYEHLKGMLLLENYRDAESTDIYICSGKAGGETYIPRFTFHGYRYIEISGVSRPPKLNEVESIQLSSVSEFTGWFECSDALVNRFAENIRWSEWCNFISIPTDCPQRNERMGWAGDTHVFCRTATYNSDTRLFYYRNLQAFRDLQENGRYPNIAPGGGGFGGITYESAPIIMVWEIYQQFGDTGVIREFYQDLKAYMEYIGNKGMPGIVFVGPLGDWLAVEETDYYLLWNAFYGYDCQIMAKLAEAIGFVEDAKHFERLTRRVHDYWNDTFVDSATGKTCDADGNLVDTQCSYALPLCFGMFNQENKKMAGRHLARKTKDIGYIVSTGFFGTGCLNEALTEAGYPEIAYELMCQIKYPSWLYPVTQGATTIWERWDSFTLEKGFGGNNNMNSFNHYSLGSVLSWIYAYVLGIRREEQYPGYKYFTLCPCIEKLNYAKGGFRTPYGDVSSSWRRDEEKIFYSCRIPANSSARLILPDGEIKEGMTPVETHKVVQILSRDGNRIILEVSSGDYTFEIG